MAFKFANAWASQFTAPVAAADATLTIIAADAALLVSKSGWVTGDTIRLTIPSYDGAGNETSWEIVDVTDINTSTGVLTVTRAVEGGTAGIYPEGRKIAIRLTAGQLNFLSSASGGDFKTDGSTPMTGDLPMGGHAITANTDAKATISATAATTSIDVATKRKFKINVGADTTLSFANVPTADLTVVVRLVWGSPGPYTVTLPTGTLTSGGLGLTLSTAAGSIDDVVFDYDHDLGVWSAYQPGAGMA